MMIICIMATDKLTLINNVVKVRKLYYSKSKYYNINNIFGYISNFDYVLITEF